MTNFIVEYLKQKNIPHLSIAAFIELALYDSQHGYYQREKEKIGKKGDFLTTSSFSPFFAKIICRWFHKKVELEGVQPSFIEIGAGNGNFAFEFIKHWSNLTTLPLTYTVVERSKKHMELLKKRLYNYKNVNFLADLEDVYEIKGIIFSNELFDALPVHVVKYSQDIWLEKVITLKNNELMETYIPLSDRQLTNYFSNYGLQVIEEHEYEIPMAMIELYSEFANKLVNGYIITIDYGYFHEELTKPFLKDGTLRTYFEHQLGTKLLDNVGYCDITTHIHWDTLQKVGENNQLDTLEISTQQNFLLNNDILSYLVATSSNPFSEEAKQNRQIRQLVLDGSISNAFHVLIQQRKDKVD